MEKYRVKNKKRINYNGGFTITKSWFYHGVHKCKAVNDLNQEYTFNIRDLEEIKTESNK
jgi:hypothetical protein